MPEKSIIMTTESIQAILAGRKTQTRRVIKPQYAEINTGERIPLDEFIGEIGLDGLAECAPCQPGDVLWVREAWRLVDFEYVDDDFSASVQFKDISLGPRLHGLTGDERTGWRSPRFMPRAAARIFLRVTGVRVERVQDISEEDAKAEGANFVNGKNVGFEEKMCGSAIVRYRDIWDGLNAKRGHPWESNPWVWCYTFELVEEEAVHS